MKTQKLICAVAGLAFIGASQSLIGEIPIGNVRPTIQAARIRSAITSLCLKNKIFEFANMMSGLKMVDSKSLKEFIVKEMKPDEIKLLASTLADFSNKMYNDKFSQALKKIYTNFFEHHQINN